MSLRPYSLYLFKHILFRDDNQQDSAANRGNETKANLFLGKLKGNFQKLLSANANSSKASADEPIIDPEAHVNKIIDKYKSKTDINPDELISEYNSMISEDKTAIIYKPFECDICHLKFPQESKLKLHKNTHLTNRPFKCNLCDYQAAFKYLLKEHMFKHKEKPVKCTLCSYTCVRNSTLKVHMGTHSKDKRIKCDLCNYQCTQKFQLMSHMYRHNGIKPFACDKCDFATTRRQTLRRHKDTNHQ